MGELSLDLFSPKKWQDLQNLSDPSVTNFFKALGLVWAYQNMMRILERGMKSNIEIKRVPALGVYMMRHLTDHYKDHIKLDSMSLFSEETAGSLQDLRRWQASRPPDIKRTAKNYERRLAGWKSIYDNTYLRVRTVGLKRGGGRFSYIVLRRITNEDGSLVTYEQVIRERNEGFAALPVLVPFWMALNHGTNGVTPGQPGYPATKPIHFVEKGEMQKPRFIEAAALLYERFALEVLDKEKQGGTLEDAFTWAKSKRSPIRTNYFHHYDAARLVALS